MRTFIIGITNAVALLALVAVVIIGVNFGANLGARDGHQQPINISQIFDNGAAKQTPDISLNGIANAAANTAMDKTGFGQQMEVVRSADLKNTLAGK